MKRYFCILDGDIEYRLPVTPSSVRLQSGIKIETVSICGLGDIQLAGNKTVGDIAITSFFPAFNYTFVIGDFRQPYEWIGIFKDLITQKKTVRFLIPDTDINLRVIVSNIEYGEDAGLNDVRYTITLSEYGVDNAEIQRTTDNAPAPPETYTVVYGDTLWSIAQRFYGDGFFYRKIAAVNGIRDPNVLRVGQTLKLPRRE